MIDIAVNDLQKEYQVGQPVLTGLTFQVDTGERVGILGKNGAGKTTLFRILTGQEEADGGTVTLAPGKRLGLISQIPVYPAGYTVEDVLRTAFDDLKEMEGQMQALSAQLATGDPDLLARYDRLQAAFEAGGGYEIETRLEKICTGLGIDKAFRAKAFADLSGGEKTRINLARLILVDTEILLLDEPTNHLDLNATVWLEDYVSHYKGTVLVISHDRYFLDKTISRVIEIKEGKAEFYAGNYSFYAVEKQRRYLEQLRQYKKEQAEIQRLTETARIDAPAQHGAPEQTGLLHRKAHCQDEPHRPAGAAAEDEGQVRPDGVSGRRPAHPPGAEEVLRGADPFRPRLPPGGAGGPDRPLRGQRHRQVHPAENSFGGGGGPTAAL